MANRLGRQQTQSEITTQGKADHEPTALKLWGSPEAGGAEHEGSRAKANLNLKKRPSFGANVSNENTMWRKHGF